MEWKPKANETVFTHIVALLLALADLADRARSASRPVRRHVLLVLQPAEAVAQMVTLGLAQDIGASIPPTAGLAICAGLCAPDGAERGDAAQIAQRLRLLALALASLSAQAACLEQRATQRIALSMTAAANITMLRMLPQRAAHGQNIPTHDTS